MHQLKIKQLKHLIGHALENIVPCQLPSYFALLYNLVSLQKLIENKPSNKYLQFTMKLQWSNGTKVTNILPAIKAPVSAINFWVKHLGLEKNKLITSFKNHGYCSTKEIMADMIGFYEYYESPRSFYI